MSAIEETIDATLDSNGQLRLAHQPQLPPGPVRVTIRAAQAPRRGQGFNSTVARFGTYCALMMSRPSVPRTNRR